MNGMCKVFLTVCDMSVTAVFAIVLVLIARLLLRKAPRRFSYYLWIIVAFRLMCPYSFTSEISIFNLGIFGGHMTGNQAGWTDAAGILDEQGIQGTDNVSGTEGMSGEENGAGAESTPVETGISVTESRAKSGGLDEGEQALLTDPVNETEDPLIAGRDSGAWDRRGMRLELLTGLWILGAAVFLGTQIYSYRRLRKRVATAVRIEEGVCECENIEVPFVMGFFKPVIYLPFGITESERRYILSHEKNHVRRRDHQVKYLAVLILSVYWFHPLVWLAYRLMCEDMEVSCDEKAVQALTGEGKEGYCQTLLNFASGGGAGLLPDGGTSFGGSSVKRRVKNILKLKSAKTQAAVLGIAMCVMIVWIGLANGQQDVMMRCVKGPGAGDIEYEYKLSKKIQSFLIYKEYYHEGEMRSYEIVRAVDLDKAGVKRNGIFTMNAKRKLSNGRFIFQNRFEGEEREVRNITSPGDYDYQGMAENYYLDAQTGWKGAEKGEELVLAAWHLLGGGQDEFRRTICQEFMNTETKQHALEENTGEILYYLVFSDKSAEELKKEYEVSPYAQTLYKARNPYVGDAAADGKLMECMGMFPDMKRTIEIQTEEEPYVLTIHYEDQPQDEIDFHRRMEKKAILLLCLIENAGKIEWTYSAETEKGETERRFYCDKEKASKLLMLEETEDIRRFSESKNGVQELLTEYMSYIYMNHTVNVTGLGDENEDEYILWQEDKELYPIYVVGRLPGESYDDVFMVPADEDSGE